MIHAGVVATILRDDDLLATALADFEAWNKPKKYRASMASIFRGLLERDAELKKLYGEKGEVAFGNQIRNYVMQPYQLVKDVRTDTETGNIQAVMDGDLDPFIDSYLRWRAGGAEE